MTDDADADHPTLPSGLERMQAYLHGEHSPGGMVRLVGMRPIAVEHGRMSFEADPLDDHLNSGGTVHGGYTTTLLDTAMGCAAISVVSGHQSVTTIELKVSFHRAITPATGRVLVHGEVISHGRRVVFTQARLTDIAGKVLASATSSLMVLQK